MRIRQENKFGILFSVTVHAALLLAGLGLWNSRSVLLSAKRLPGTAHGNQRVLLFSMGGAPASSKSITQNKPKPVETAVPRTHATSKAAPILAASAKSAAGAGVAGENALGDGNISIALVKYHPRPTPDLSSLPQGTGGDVVLDATIDAQGKVADLKLAKGFGGAIDQVVIATVQQWTFAPATKDGVPVASEQEILFHYERS